MQNIQGSSFENSTTYLTGIHDKSQIIFTFLPNICLKTVSDKGICSHCTYSLHPFGGHMAIWLFHISELRHCSDVTAPKKCVFFPLFVLMGATDYRML